jgi:putative phosphotransacetylase
VRRRRPKGSLTTFASSANPPGIKLEISRADCFTLGIKAPVRESGQLENAGSALLIGPAGHVELRSGDLRLAAYPYVAAGCAAS